MNSLLLTVYSLQMITSEAENGFASISSVRSSSARLLLKRMQGLKLLTV